MKIGFDAKRLFHNDTGLGVYSRLLVRGMKELERDAEFLLFAKDPVKSAHYQDFSDLPIIRSSQILWRTRGMTKDLQKNHCQIFHGLSNELPIGLKRTKIKSLVTIHDVIFKRDPSLYPWFDRKIYDLKWQHSAKNSDVIIAVSQSTKSDLCDYYGVDEEKIQVIYPPVRVVSTIQDARLIKSRYKLPQKFYLSVGALTPRKNVISILKAMHISKPELRIPLVIVGSGPEKKVLQQFVHTNNLRSSCPFPGPCRGRRTSIFLSGCTCADLSFFL